MKLDKKQLRWRQLAQEEREMRGKFQTIIDTSTDTVSSHAPHHVEENMVENHSRRRLGNFRRRTKPHALSEKHVSA